jgi:hypothetical protein
MLKTSDARESSLFKLVVNTTAHPEKTKQILTFYKPF